MSDATSIWIKSSYSGGANTECVEAAVTNAGVAIRDSKDPEGPILQFGGDAWASFVAAVRDGGLA